MPANLELSSYFNLTNEPQASGCSSVWPLKYWTTASPELLEAVTTWNVRPCFLRQWNLSWVKDKCLLSSFMALFCRTMCNLPIPRYDVSTDTFGEGLPNLTFDTRSQPLHMTRSVPSYRHDVLTVPLTDLLHCPITSMTRILSCCAQIGRLVITNRVGEFCYSFD